MTDSRRNELVIALIGLLGILVTATISNWDQLMPGKGVIRTKYTGYRASGDFERELRYFFKVSGSRKAIEDMELQLMDNLKVELKKEYPYEAKEIDAVMKAAGEESIPFDELLTKLMPVYKKHYTVKELQELNRFYSTETMQAMVKKNSLMIKEAAPIQAQIIMDYNQRFIDRLDEILD